MSNSIFEQLNVKAIDLKGCEVSSDQALGFSR
ncbi:hypothetical protein MUB24_16965 [Lederbergia sp. NSJ-179]|nr:hypothetical protein [Lederbergia sp. NSJ-179]